MKNLKNILAKVFSFETLVNLIIGALLIVAVWLLIPVLSGSIGASVAFCLRAGALYLLLWFLKQVADKFIKLIEKVKSYKK